MGSFDLIEYQEKARGLSTAKELFELWDKVCQHYDHSEIGKYELDEMKSTIWPALTWISTVNEGFEDAASRRGADIIDMCPPEDQRTKYF